MPWETAHHRCPQRRLPSCGQVASICAVLTSLRASSAHDSARNARRFVAGSADHRERSSGPCPRFTQRASKAVTPRADLRPAISKSVRCSASDDFSGRLRVGRVGKCRLAWSLVPAQSARGLEGGEKGASLAARRLRAPVLRRRGVLLSHREPAMRSAASAPFTLGDGAFPLNTTIALGCYRPTLSEELPISASYD